MSQPTLTQSDSQRARTRATTSKLRAYCHSPGLWYDVWNLTKHVKYNVWYNIYIGKWECTCPANNRDVRCKHVQRVMDREEKRIRLEALNNG